MLLAEMTLLKQQLRVPWLQYAHRRRKAYLWQNKRILKRRRSLAQRKHPPKNQSKLAARRETPICCFMCDASKG